MYAQCCTGRCIGGAWQLKLCRHERIVCIDKFWTYFEICFETLNMLGLATVLARALRNNLSGDSAPCCGLSSRKACLFTPTCTPCIVFALANCH